MTRDSGGEARGRKAPGFGANSGEAEEDHFTSQSFAPEPLELTMKREREKIITQDIPVRVLHPDTVETIMQPKVREPDVHIQLPPLLQLKAISDRFTKLALTTSTNSRYSTPKLVLQANMHGSLRLSLHTDTLSITSTWTGLENPELDESQLPVPIEEHPSTIFKRAGPDRWATVRVDGRDWSRVLSVGRLEGRVIACFCDEHALILYVYVPHLDGGDQGREERGVGGEREDVVTVSSLALQVVLMLRM